MTKAQFFTRALAALTVVGALVVTAPTGVPGAPQAADAVVGDCTPGSDWGTPRQDFASRVVDLVNQHRASKGLSQLTVSTHADELVDLEVAPHGEVPLHGAQRPGAAHRAERRRAARRLRLPVDDHGLGREHRLRLHDAPSAVMQGWLNSAGHRANIENPELPLDRRRRRLEHTGRIYWAQAFGTQTGSTPPPPPPPPTSYKCSNGQDDDGDGKIDYPADPGCTSSTDNDEFNAPAPPPPPPPTYKCSNGQDDDGDGKIDYPADPGCTSSTDNDEFNAPAPPPPPPPTYNCSNGQDDDGDGKIDYPADPGCTSSTDNDEFNTTAPPPPPPRRR